MTTKPAKPPGAAQTKSKAGPPKKPATPADGAPRVRQTMLDLWAGRDVTARERARRNAYRNLFASPDGRIVLADIIMSAGFLVARPPMDAIALAHGEGARWLVTEILAAAGVERAPLAMAIVADDLSLALDTETDITGD